MDRLKSTEIQNMQTGEARAVIAHRGGGVYRVRNGMCRAVAVGYAARPALSASRESDSAADEPAVSTCKTGKVAADVPAVSTCKTGKAAADVPAVSGDRAGSFSLPSGRLALILSDGMGQGIRAAAYSKLAVRKLKRELKRGALPASAIKSTNRSMCSCFANDLGCQIAAFELNDAFATLDLMIFDASKNSLSFYKQGAAPSYILRGGEFKVLRRSALPVGVLPKLSTPNSHITLKVGDVLLMVSDGVSDVYEYDFCEAAVYGMATDAPYVRLHKLAANLTARIDSGRLSSPRQIAKAVIDFTNNICPYASDDMTVIAFLIS